MSRLRLRDYQDEAVAAVRGAHAGQMRRPAIVLPTGAGKTPVFAKVGELVLDDARKEGIGGRVLVLAHRDELIRQAVDKITSVAPHLRVGVVMGTSDQVGADVVVGSVQTLRHDRRLNRVRNVRAVIVDECHHATAPSYRKILTHYGAIVGEESGDRRAVALGVTATMTRADSGALGDIWEEVVYKKSIAWMIRKGHLVEPHGLAVRVEDFNLAAVKRKSKASGGDYDDASLGEALSNSLAPKKIIEAWQKYASTRPTILFSPSVEFASIMADEFNAAGISAALVHGMQAKDERRAALADFRAGRVQVLCNCMVLTEGTDLPLASCAIIARPTRNKGLWIQMTGRVLRPDKASGKSDALILVVTGAGQHHSLNAEVDLVGGQEDLDAIKGDDDEIEDGEDVTDLMAEMFDDEEEGRGTDDVTYADGELVAEKIDLFAGARSAWNTTYGGAHYIPAGSERFIVVCGGMEPGTYDVASVGRASGGSWLQRGVRDLGYAMAYAEDDVKAHEAALTHRSRTWRAKPVSDKQRWRCERMRILLPVGATSGDAADLMNRVEASYRIDASLPGWARLTSQ